MDGCGLGIIFGIILFALIIVGIISTAGKMEEEKNKKINDARANYQDALLKLKKDPANPDQRQKTLELGRIYSNLARDAKGVTLFDEMALMNDINAACGGTTGNQIASPSSQSAEERLKKLSDLKTKGLINDQEYEEKRKQILNDV